MKKLIALSIMVVCLCGFTLGCKEEPKKPATTPAAGAGTGDKKEGDKDKETPAPAPAPTPAP